MNKESVMKTSVLCGQNGLSGPHVQGLVEEDRQHHSESVSYPNQKTHRSVLVKASGMNSNQFA